jgi:hypothetical protein
MKDILLFTLPVITIIVSHYFPDYIFPAPPQSCQGDVLLAHCKKLSERGFAYALVTISVVFGICLPYLNNGYVKISPSTTPSDRLTYSLTFDIFTGLFYAFAILNVAIARSNDPSAVMGQRTGVGLNVELASRKLQNSTEQLLLNIISRSTLAIVIKPEESILLPASVSLFLMGRVLFFYGYSATNPMGREFGFDLTILSSISCLLFALMKIIF